MRKPVVTPFTQQNLKTWKPVMTPKCMIPSCFILGIMFLSIGIVLKVVSDSVVEAKLEYGNKCQISKVCELSITIDAKIPKPVFVYYGLKNFYQNSKQYVKSVSNSQLSGSTENSKLCDECKPLASPNSDRDCSTLGTVYYPCGMIADSYFNDTFALLKDKDDDDSTFTIKDNGLTWLSDSKSFKPANYAKGKWKPPPSWTDITDIKEIHEIVTSERFQVWMRPSGFSDFKKLYGRIDEDIPPGTYTVKIDNYYPTSVYKGSKTLYFTSISFLGGKTYFLSSMYICFGFFFVALGLGFLYQNLYYPRRLGDPKYLSWKKNPPRTTS